MSRDWSSGQVARWPRTRTTVLRVVALILLSSCAQAVLLKMEKIGSKGRFADLAAMLEDSVLCDTCVCTDGQGRMHRVFCDSGRVYYQRPVCDAGGRVVERSSGQASDTAWIVPIRLSFRGVNSSPVVFLMDEPGERTRVVAMWREEHEDWVEVWFRYHYPGALPMQWSWPFSLAQPRY